MTGLLSFIRKNNVYGWIVEWVVGWVIGWIMDGSIMEWITKVRYISLSPSLIDNIYLSLSLSIHRPKDT